VILPLRFPSFDKMRRGEVVITIAEHESRFATGLQVTADPGVGVVYAGFVAMLVGCFATFFLSHQHLCVDVERQGSGCRVTVSGAANKNRLAVQALVQRLAGQLAKAAAAP
jgi:cytochrome c biogenesis protein